MEKFRCKVRDSQTFAKISTALFGTTALVAFLHLAVIGIFATSCNDCGNTAYWIIVEFIPFMLINSIGFINGRFASKKSMLGNSVGINKCLVWSIILSLIGVTALSAIKFVTIAIGSVFGSFGLSQRQLMWIFLSIVINAIYSIILIPLSLITLPIKHATIDNRDNRDKRHRYTKLADATRSSHNLV